MLSATIKLDHKKKYRKKGGRVAYRHTGVKTARRFLKTLKGQDYMTRLIGRTLFITIK